MATSDEATTKRHLVVIVEDDQSVRNALRSLFASEGFSVRLFASGRQLFAEASPPAGDCFVVDQNMPDMSGLDLISMLRAHNLTTPAILITSDPNSVLRKRAASAGVPIVEKPFLDLSLLDKVCRSLARGSVVASISR